MSDLRNIRLKKAQALQGLNKGPYSVRFEVTHRSSELKAEHSDLPNGEERDVSIAIAGRILSRRVMGKLAFFTLSDESGTIQLYLEKATLALLKLNNLEASSIVNLSFIPSGTDHPSKVM